MKKFLALLLILGLALPQALLADEAASLSPTAQAADSPALPAAADAKDLPADISAKDADKGVETPQGQPAGKAESVVLKPEKPSGFRWGNFFLGALGGGILAGGAGFLFFTGSQERRLH